MGHISNAGYAIVDIDPNSIPTLQSNHNIRLAILDDGSKVWRFQSANSPGSKWVEVTISVPAFSELQNIPTTIAGYGITDYDSLWDTRLGTKSTTDLTEGTNLYYTESRVAANSSVAANTAKVGITTQQAASIVTNSSKISFDTDQNSELSTGGVPAFLGAKLTGSSSGQATIQTPPAAGNPILTLPTTTDTLVGGATTDTLSNKRIKPRVGTALSTPEPAINTDDYDAYSITALDVNITSMTTGLSGTPTDFQKLIIRIKDDGVSARTITWGTGFEAKGVALPTTTVLSKVLTIGFIYDTVTSKWGCVASLSEA